MIEAVGALDYVALARTTHKAHAREIGLQRTGIMHQVRVNTVDARRSDEVSLRRYR